jgi:hypothetical protein
MGEVRKLRALGAYITDECNRRGGPGALADVADALIASTSPSDETDVAQAHSRVSFAACWAACGFPQVLLPHRLAASLMATKIPAEALPEVESPWTCFMVAVPDGLLSLPIHGVGLIVDPARPVRVLFAGDCYAGAEAGSLRELVAASLADDGPTADALRLALRLVLGVCVELDSDHHRQAIAAGGSPGRIHRRGKEPVSWTYRLTRDVKVDCRAWVRDYCLHGGKSPTVQSLVRGHHRRQRCGPDGALRKWIHVEPYWRGPEDAPIAVRSHVLGENHGQTVGSGS